MVPVKNKRLYIRLFRRKAVMGNLFKSGLHFFNKHLSLLFRLCLLVLLPLAYCSHLTPAFLPASYEYSGAGPQIVISHPDESQPHPDSCSIHQVAETSETFRDYGVSPLPSVILNASPVAWLLRAILIGRLKPAYRPQAPGPRPFPCNPPAFRIQSSLRIPVICGLISPKMVL